MFLDVNPIFGEFQIRSGKLSGPIALSGQSKSPKINLSLPLILGHCT